MLKRGGREVDLDGHAGVAQVADALEHAVELAQHADLVEGRARAAVEAHLDRLDAEVAQARRRVRREEVPVGLDLELAAARAHVIDHLEEVRMEHRLAAGERKVRDLERHHLLEHREDLLSPSSSLNFLPGPLSSMQCMHARLHSLVICQAT
jgi:hypothetical protein